MDEETDDQRVDIGGTTIHLKQPETEASKPTYSAPAQYSYEDEGLLDRIGFDWKNRWLLLAVALIFGGLFLYVVLFWIGPASLDTDPLNRYTIPTAQPTSVTGTTNIDMVKFWRSRGNWLSTEGGSGLRKEVNAINLAFLSDGGALYSTNESIDPKTINNWPVSERPVGMKQATPKGTSINFVLNNFTYELNVNQPFVWDTLPRVIFVFDDAGILHGKQFSEDDLVSLDTAKGNLSQTIPANANLTLSFTR